MHESTSTYTCLTTDDSKLPNRLRIRFLALMMTCAIFLIVETMLTYRTEYFSIKLYENYTQNYYYTATQNGVRQDVTSTFLNTKDSSLAYEKPPSSPYFLGLHPSHHSSNKLRRNHGLSPIQSDVSVKRNATKLILFYNPPYWWQDVVMPLCEAGIQTCPVQSCSCSNHTADINRADAVIVESFSLNSRKPMRKEPSQVWIFFTMEPPFYKLREYKIPQWSEMFNWTMTYRLNSDVPVPYGIVLRQRMSRNYNAIAESKRKSAVWITSHCNTTGRREVYVKELQKFYNVDIFGMCGTRTKKDFLSIIKPYRFYLAFENSFCHDYISEKLFKTFDVKVNIIPVVRGGANYDTMIPKGTYINTEHFHTPEELGEHLTYLEKNVTAYAEYLQRNDQFHTRGIYDMLQNSFCDVCVKLHNLKRYGNWYSDISDWYNVGSCTIPTDISV